jgi:DNA-binding GntR family transcriptional regulator
MTADDGARLLALMEQYADASRRDDPSARDIHAQFHMGLYELSGSKWLLRLLPMLWDNAERYRRLALPIRGSTEERIEEHKAIVEAALVGDLDAAEHALRMHLSNSFDAAIERLRQQEEGAV